MKHTKLRMDMNEIGALLFAAKVYPTTLHTNVIICVNEKKKYFFVQMVGHIPHHQTSQRLNFFLNKPTLLHGMVYIAVEQQFLNQYLLWSRLFY